MPPNFVTRVISLFVLYSIALFYGWLICLRILWMFCWTGFALFDKNRKTQVPSCLNDPELGEHHYLTTKSGNKFHYVAKGDVNKPLMLCLHGFPEFWFSWRFQLKGFCDEYRVVAPDLRGYGGSFRPKAVAQYKFHLLCEDIQEMVESLGYSSCILVAHDWGGLIAWNVAHRYPEIVDRLIILNAPHPRIFEKHMFSSLKQFLMSWYIFFQLLPCFPEMFYSLGNYAIFDQHLAGKLWTDEVVEAYKYSFSQPGVLTAGINYYRSALLHADQQEWKREGKRTVTAPTLVVWGNKDAYLDTNLLNGLEEHVENLTIKVVEGANHWVQADEPEIVNGHIRKFL